MTDYINKKINTDKKINISEWLKNKKTMFHLKTYVPLAKKCEKYLKKS